jgi:hypothetical protein
MKEKFGSKKEKEAVAFHSPGLQDLAGSAGAMMSSN